MTRIVALKLASIEYSGDSIGDDIRLEIEAPGAFVGINKKLSNGKSADLNKEIAQFVTSGTSFSLPVNIRVIERDSIFNDVGSLQATVKVDLSRLSPQRSTHKIEVVESGGIFGRSIAVFHLTLEALVLEATRYISNVSLGWLTVRLEDNGSKISLPAALKVQIDRIESRREYFTIMEGAYRGKKSSVRLGKDGSSYLSTRNPQTATVVHLVYSISKKTLDVEGKTYLTKDYPSTPWAKGLYDVEIPDAPQRGGLNYPDVIYAKTWFRVGHEGDRYIHTGRDSLGCITVIERNRWDDLYSILIKARKGDGVSIGTLQVED